MNPARPQLVITFKLLKHLLFGISDLGFWDLGFLILGLCDFGTLDFRILGLFCFHFRTLGLLDFSLHLNRLTTNVSLVEMQVSGHLALPGHSAWGCVQVLQHCAHLTSNWVLQHQPPAQVLKHCNGPVLQHGARKPA